MTKEEALKQFAMFGAAWFGNSKQHFAFSAYCRLQGWNKLADKWKEEAEEEWEYNGTLCLDRVKPLLSQSLLGAEPSR